MPRVPVKKGRLRFTQSIVQNSDRIFGTGIIDRHCFCSEGSFLVGTQIALGGPPLFIVRCGSLLRPLRNFPLLDFFHGHIYSELGVLDFLGVYAIFATYFLLIADVWEHMDCFKDLRIQGFLKARLVVSLAIKFIKTYQPFCLFASDQNCVCDSLPMFCFVFSPYISLWKLLWFFASSNLCLSPTA